jgi:hypothetical protein
VICAIGGRFDALAEVFVNNIFFGVGLVELFFFDVFFVGVLEFADGELVDGILLFEVVIEIFFVRPLSGAGAGDVIDGHLAEHGAEIGCSLERLFLFVKVVHLFDGAGVEGGVVVLLVQGLLYQGACLGDEGAWGRFRDDVAGRMESCDLVRKGS